MSVIAPDTSTSGPSKQVVVSQLHSKIVSFRDTVGYCVSYPMICFVMILMSSIVLAEPVWVWINDDQEEDTVRFRQRLVFVGFWFVSIGLIHIRNSYVRGTKNV